MEEERPHEQRRASRYAAGMLSCFQANGFDSGLGDTALPVRSGDDAQRSVLLMTIVKAEPHGKHRLEHGDGRLRVQYASFH
jgi:hypothetical protein